MPILPLPQFESDLAELERERRVERLVARGYSRDEVSGLDASDLARFERRRPPRTLVVRFGSVKLIGEYPYDGDVTPGCGSRVVARTHRGTEVAEMLTSTCPNAGCSKSISRQEMLSYVENSGGRDYPFFRKGRVLRIATADDLARQQELEQRKNEMRLEARAAVEAAGLPCRVVEVEPILGGETTTCYYTCEDRIDHAALALAIDPGGRTRLEFRQVGARDEARLVADYEKCGQYCCCKNFLKVLRPISMKAAKIQKATLDPLKISGRCGRLMCCLRYEEETYDDLRKRLPRKKSRVGTPDGDGVVVDTQILTQLALVELDSGERIAVPVEELTAPGEATPREKPTPSVAAAPRPRPPRPAPSQPRLDPPADVAEAESAPADDATDDKPRRKRRRRRKRSAADDAGTTGPGPSHGPSPARAPEDGDDEPAVEDSEGPAGEETDQPAEDGAAASSGRVRKRRRRRRRRPSDGPASGDASGPADAAPPGPPDVD